MVDYILGQGPQIYLSRHYIPLVQFPTRQPDTIYVYTRQVGGDGYIPLTVNANSQVVADYSKDIIRWDNTVNKIPGEWVLSACLNPDRFKPNEIFSNWYIQQTTDEKGTQHLYTNPCTNDPNVPCRCPAQQVGLPDSIRLLVYNNKRSNGVGPFNWMLPSNYIIQPPQLGMGSICTCFNM